MKNGKKDSPIQDIGESPIGATEQRLNVIKHLNEMHAQYVIIGGIACIFHGMLRTTKDIDLLIPKGDVANTERILEALKDSQFWGMAGELDSEKIANKPFTIIGDQPRVDLLTVAGKIKFEEAIKTAHRAKIKNVIVVYADIDTLIKTKKTSRPSDAVDILQLEEIKKRQRKK